MLKIIELDNNDQPIFIVKAGTLMLNNCYVSDQKTTPFYLTGEQFNTDLEKIKTFI